jgi:hypothetical protein
MKRIIFCFVFLFIVSKLAHSQVAYYDAITLKKYILAARFDNGKRGAIDTILSHYLTDPDATITSAFSINPFLRDFFPDRTPHNGIPGLSGIISAAGNLDVTNIADGLARFLIKRGKQELNIAFFQRMKEFLDKNIEAHTLFPATAAFLGNIAAYRYSELLQSLREAFYKDISTIIVNLNLLIDLPKYKQLLQALPEIRLAIRSAKIISELSQSDSSMHPANLISHFANLNEWGEMNINLKSSWKTLDKISESVRRLDTIRNSKYDTLKIAADSFVIKTTVLSDEVSRVDSSKILKGTPLIIRSVKMKLTPSKEIAWIKFSDFNENILKDTITLKIYLGLLYQKMEGISFRYDTNNSINVQQFMADNSDNILKLADLVENFLVLANDVEQSIKNIREKKGGLTNDDYYTYIEKAINVVDYGFKVANTIKEGIASDRYIVMARNGNNLFKNIYTKNYNAAVMNSYLILQEVLSRSKNAIDEKNIVLTANGTMNNPVNRSFPIANNVMNQNKFFNSDSIDKRSKLVEEILKYGNVIASIVKAEKPEEAEAAIEAAVLPAGSSSIKKNTAWNISLNAYIGGYITNDVNNIDKIDGNSSKVGVTAPVGIAFSKGLGNYPNGAPIGAISIYGTLINVGAIAGYRLNNDSSVLEQKVTLNDIFTPGGYLVYGIGLPFKGLSYVPLSVGYGLQYSSRLYQKKSNGKLDISGESRWRRNWFIAIDIPLANFWTKNYKKKE